MPISHIQSSTGAAGIPSPKKPHGGSRREVFWFVNQSLGPFFKEIIRVLAERGHTVHVVTGRDWSGCVDLPNVHFFPGPAYRRDSAVSRLLAWLRFAAFVRKILHGANAGDVVLLASNPPILPNVRRLRAGDALRVAVRILDIYPDALAGRLPKPVEAMLRPFFLRRNRRVFERADLRVTLGEHMKRRLEEQAGNASFVVIPDWATFPIEATENAAPPEPGASRGELKVVYAGNLGANHDLDAFLEGLAKAQSGRSISFTLAGKGSGRAKLETRAQELGLQGFRAQGYLSDDAYRDLLRGADVAVVAVDRLTAHSMMPSKTYNYMAAGCAILALCPEECDLANVVDANDCGVVCDPGDPSGIESALEGFVEDPARLASLRSNARLAAARHYSPANAERMADALEAHAMG